MHFFFLFTINSTNTIFMPHLPCDTQDYVMTDRHELLLDSQLLLQPLIHLLNMQILKAESTVKAKSPNNVRVSALHCI